MESIFKTRKKKMRRISTFIAEIPIKPKKQYSSNKLFDFKTSDLASIGDPGDNLTSRLKFNGNGQITSPQRDQDVSSRTAAEREKYKRILFRNFGVFCLKTNAHGIRNIYKATNWMIRIIWTALIVAFTGYCTFSKLFQYLAFVLGNLFYVDG